MLRLAYIEDVDQSSGGLERFDKSGVTDHI